jgi:predicted chitinase
MIDYAQFFAQFPGSLGQFTHADEHIDWSATSRQRAWKR